MNLRGIRSLIALSMTVIHLMMAASPAASFAVHKAKIPVGAAKCAGDEATCGCSIEATASDACCCATKARLDRLKEKVSCCRHGYEGGTTVMQSCVCPRGGFDTSALLGADVDHGLTPRHLYPPPFQYLDEHLPSIATSLTSRHLEPPVPPPKKTRLPNLRPVPLGGELMPLAR